MIPEETVNAVRAAVNIADYIGQYVQLRAAGQNLFGLCPFHDENTGSFSVNESKQIFKCFSCGRGGNVFSFVMEYDHLSFPEAVAKVAAFANIPINVDVQAHKAPVDPKVAAQKALLQKVSDLCHHILVNTQGGEAALAYLTKRGLSRETIDHFDIGYAPSDRNLMRTFLSNQGVDYDTQRASGLFTEDQNGNLFDRFNDRVMFPLKDEFGAIVGFSGRVLSGDHQQAKYLNSPETALFNKRDVLFNLDGAKNEFKQFGGAVLFEGFMDVIAAYQAGIKVGIASMGTSLTSEQVGIIAHHTRTVTICYDGDAAGQKATERALSLVEHHPRLQTGVVVLPEQMDPDEYIKARGADAFASQVRKVLTPNAFRLHFLAQDLDMTNDRDKLTYLDQALKIVAQEPTAATQTVYLQQVSTTTGVPVADLRQSLPTVAAPASDFGAPPPEDYGSPPPEQEFVGGFAPPVGVAPISAPHYDKFELAERRLLAYAYGDAQLARRLHTSGFVFAHPAYQRLFDAWQDYAAQGVPTIAGYLDAVPQELVQTATDLSLLALPEADDGYIDDLIQVVKEAGTYQQLQQVKQSLRQAQQLGDKAGATQLSVQYIQLLRAYKTNSN